MNFFDYIKNYKLLFILISFVINLLLIIISLIYIFKYYSYSCSIPIIEDNIAKSDDVKTSIDDSFYVEVKGAVNKPGVYYVNNNNIVNDLIILADGFTKNAYTKNINLSKKLKSELVVYVYTQNEYKKSSIKEYIKTITCECPTYEISKCVEEFASEIIPNESINMDETIDENNDLININTASKEELMTLSGIGESRALDIINYRTNNGYFKSIEEIKNVSGIGNSLYEKIKNSITI